ncbi:hypothetical protein MIND_00876600 [Mycena indigotica]|uniref:Uncharacterized protein n=1 Tax=Mycena indigotica TaxID=2126181 RepID=A0A8H6SJ53_9AGAR|nr:uncharacterized protein MIND_00876600 [Mycena indigotica]KAF7299277.1 hypothetical protein MIND_00876600 [Mycena indigotica]
MPSTTTSGYNTLIHEAELSLKELSVNTIDDAAIALSLLFRLQSWKANRSPDTDMTSVVSCTQLLNENPALNSLLNIVQRQDCPDYSLITHSPLFPALVSEKSRKILQDLRMKMGGMAEGNSLFPVWVPPVVHSHPIYKNVDVQNHCKALQLRKSADMSPDFCIILHGLGEFKHDEVLGGRVERLFSSKHKFFVNASGTGKTRLCYEGLTSHWGLYFTLEVDSGNLGSLDMEDKLNYLMEKHQYHRVLDHDALEQNSRLAKHEFGSILLSRLLVFQLFLEFLVDVDNGALTNDHKMRWLEIQLTPSIFGVARQDVFTRLGNALGEDETDVANLQVNIDDVLRKIQHVIGSDPIFVVIDEAQIGVEENLFVSRDGKPLLWELIRVWQTLTHGACTFICAGVNIPRSIFDGEVGADFEWTSDTGSFDDPDAHEQYIRKFLPPTLRDSPSGQFLVARLWRWCRGRHRMTDKFLNILLYEGLQFPHTTLSLYILEGTDLEPLDAVGICYEEAYPNPKTWNFSFGKPSFEALSPDDQDLTRAVLYSFMATQQSQKFTSEYTSLVSRAHACFVDAHLSEIIFDEPLVLVLAARQLFPFPYEALRGIPNNRPSTFITALQINPPRTRLSIAHCLAFYLSQVLGNGRILTDVLKFPHGIPGWARQTGQLVRFHTDDEGAVRHSIVDSDAFRSLLPLATTTSTLEETIKWIKHSYGTAFCIPSSPNLDLLCAIRLADGSFIWLAVRALATDEPMSDDSLRPMVSDLDIDSMFREASVDTASVTRAIDSLHSLPGLKQRPCLLRAVTAFPVEVDLRNCIDKRCRDAANLSFRALRRKKNQVMQEDFFEAMVNGAIAGTKRKSRWDEGAMHDNRQRAKEHRMRLNQKFGGDYIWTRVAEPEYIWDLRSEDFYGEYDPLNAVPAPRQRQAPPSRKPRKQPPQSKSRQTQKGSRRKR